MDNQTETIFTQLGGIFINSAEEIEQKLKGIKAFLFDWDGVFNDASKNEHKSSTFNEADSMGTNLLRYNYFFSNSALPKTAIISGEENNLAFYFAGREHFHATYFKIPHKIKAVEHFCNLHKIKKDEVCFVFDDVLDLSVAEKCGLRILINRKSNPLFKNYVIKNNLVDYITAAESGNFAVRELCEMIIGLGGNYDNILKERIAFSEKYQEYLQMRQSTETAIFTWVNSEITTPDF